MAIQKTTNTIFPNCVDIPQMAKKDVDLAVIAGAVGGHHVTTLPWPEGEMAPE